jgi:hypothetical protein
MSLPECRDFVHTPQTQPLLINAILNQLTVGVLVSSLSIDKVYPSEWRRVRRPSPLARVSNIALDKPSPSEHAVLCEPTPQEDRNPGSR